MTNDKTLKDLERPVVIVTCSGGLVEIVCCSQDIDVAVIDFDVDGFDEDRLHILKIDGRRCTISTGSNEAPYDDEFIELYNKVFKEEDETDG